MQEILSYNCQPIVAARSSKKGYVSARVLARNTLERVLGALRNVGDIADFKVVMRGPRGTVQQANDKLCVVALVWDRDDVLTVAEMNFT